MSMAVLLSLEYPIGGYVGICGYLTYQSELELVLEESDDDPDDPDDPFARDGSNGDDGDPQDLAVKAQTFERDLLGLDVLDHPTKDKTSCLTPSFLGHGRLDEKDPYLLREKMAEVLRASEYQVEWRCYRDLGHWYKIPDEVDDIVKFLHWGLNREYINE